MLGHFTRAERSPVPDVRTLTARQQMLIEAIDQYERGTNEPCPASWLARRFRLHRSTVKEHIEVLHRRGWLSTPNAPVRLKR